MIRAKLLRRVLLAVLAPILLLAALAYFRAEQIMLGAEAYVFGYPLVIMDVTRVNSALTLAPENQLHRVRRFPDASFRDVVRPNVDTLYSSAFIDTARGPWVFEMPANSQRYEVMPFMDAWTNVFAALGTRNASAGTAYLLVGPHWQGATLPGLTVLRAPTRIVWLIGRTQTNGVADYAIVHQLQDGLKLRSLAAWQAGRDDVAPPWQRASIKPAPPIEQMRAMSAEAFLERLSQLLVDNPPSAADRPMMDKLARLGIAPGQSPNWSGLDRWSVATGRWLADFKVNSELQKTRNLVRGWATPPSVLGNYGTDYGTRAAVAMVGLGANLPADAMYPYTRFDQNGQALEGSHRYRLHFRAGELPPVNAFWSVSAYNAQDFLIDNPLHRHALGDRDPLVFNADGSLDLYVQATPPSAEQQRNWLPVRQGEPFLLNARLYWPKAAALSGAWGMPTVERLD